MKSYILQHTDDIKIYQQNLSPWWITKSGGLDARVENALKKGALEGIALDSNTNYPAPISREDVINYFQQKLYRGFMAAMIWGKTRRLKTIVNTSPNNIEDKLKRIETKLKQGEIKEAFMSMCEDSLISKCDSNKIEGVDWAFFTKILFFMGKAFAPKRRPIPLILDSHMMFIHCALMIDDNEDIEKYYKWYIDKKGNEGVTWLRTSSDFKSDVYLDYINRMNTIAFSEGYVADKLEEYLFDTITVSPGSDIYEEVKEILNNKKTPNKNKKECNNSNKTQANNLLTTQEDALFPLLKGSNVILESFKPFDGLTNRIYHDEFVVGYIIPLKETDSFEEKKFMLFVAHNKKGYFCQIRYCYDEVDILNYRPFCKITQNKDGIIWERNSKALPTFKTVFFGDGKNGKKKALCLMRDISKEICAPKEMLDKIQNLMVQFE